MKKILGAALALTLGLTCAGALAGCDNTDNNGGDNTPTIDNADVAKRAISGIKDKYISKLSGSNTPGDYEVIGQYMVDQKAYPVTWSVTLQEGSTGEIVVKEMNQTTKSITIDVPEKTPVDIMYDLTATVTVGDKTETFTFKNIMVPKYEMMTFAEYTAAKADDSLCVQGIVTAFAKKDDGSSRNCIYFEDDDGGYYAYNLDKLPDGLAIGDMITVRGTCSVYNNKNQVVSGNATITEKATARTPKDITDIVKSASGATDTKLLDLHNQLVTIKGATLHNNTTDSTYYCFKLGNVDSYVRISTSDCPTGVENQAKIKAAHGDNLGKTATITGIVTQYNGAFYLVPADANAFKDFAESTATPADKVAAEKEAAKLVETVTKGGDVELPKPATYQDVTFTWESDNEAIKIAEDNTKMTVTVSSTVVEVKVTLTIKCGDVTEKKEFTVKIGSLGLIHAGTAADPYSAADVNKIFDSLEKGETYKEGGADKEVYILGIVTVAGEINANKNDATQTYGLKNVYIADVAGTAKEDSVLVYNINWGEAMEKADANPLQVGDLVVVKGYLKDYNGTKEVAQGSVDGKSVYPVIVSWTKAADVKKGDTEGNPLTAAETKDILDSLEKGKTYQVNGADKQVYIKAYVTDIGEINANKNDATQTYGLKNVYISDVAGAAKEDSILVYNINWGAAMGKADANPLKVGDVIVVKGYLKDYNGTKEVAQGSVDGKSVYPVITSIARKGATEAYPLTAAETKEILNSLEKGKTYQENGVDKEVYIVGIVTVAGEINANKNDATQTYGLKNVYIADVAGTAKDDSVLVYNINWGEAMEKADANPLKVGDVIIVKGYLKDYNGTKEVAQGSVNGKSVYPVIVSWTKASEAEAA